MSKNKFFKGIMVSSVTLALVLSTVFATTAVAQQKKTLKMAYVAWAECIPEQALLKEILETKMRYKVESTILDAGVLYTSIAQGDIDFGLEGWLPVTHEAYWDKFSTRIVYLPIYENAKLGWAIPEYIPKDVLNSVEDLGKPGIKEKLKGRIVGIDPGSGLMQHSSLMMKEYPALKGYELIPGSDAAMASALKRAIMRKEWIVVTSWTPHFMWGRFSKEKGGPGLRYLEEPKKILGGEEFVSILVGKNFYENLPEDVTGFLTRVWVPISHINALMLEVEEGMAPEEVAKKYIKENPKQVNYWVTGEF